MPSTVKVCAPVCSKVSSSGVPSAQSFSSAMLTGTTSPVSPGVMVPSRLSMSKRSSKAVVDPVDEVLSAVEDRRPDLQPACRGDLGKSDGGVAEAGREPGEAELVGAGGDDLAVDPAGEDVVDGVPHRGGEHGDQGDEGDTDHDRRRSRRGAARAAPGVALRQPAGHALDPGEWGPEQPGDRLGDEGAEHVGGDQDESGTEPDRAQCRGGVVDVAEQAGVHANRRPTTSSTQPDDGPPHRRPALGPDGVLPHRGHRRRRGRRGGREPAPTAR